MLIHLCLDSLAGHTVLNMNAPQTEQVTWENACAWIVLLVIRFLIWMLTLDYINFVYLFYVWLSLLLSICR